MPYRKNIIVGAVLTVFAIFYLLMTLKIRPFIGMGMAPLDSALIPRFWGICLLILSANLLLRGLRQRKVLLKSGKKAPAIGFNITAFFQKNYAVVLTFVFLVVYTALLERIGFIIMTGLFLFGEILILSPQGRKKYVFSAILSIGFAVFLNYIFVVPFSVLLPRGIIGF